MNLKDMLKAGLMSTTKTWKSEMNKADRHDRMPSYHRFYQTPERHTIKDACYRHFEEAYKRVSSDGHYWANARQLFYALRPMIQNEVDGHDLKQSYITGVLLKDYIERGLGNSGDWKIAWDGRGHFSEPFTMKRIDVGGIEVSEYRDSWDKIEEDEIKVTNLLQTKGPANRYSSILFVEKEGFNEILDEAEFAERYDMAIMSTKGMPVKAACDLLFAMPADVRIFCLHDFDKSGFTIIKTLRHGTRLARGRKVTDLGFRMEDIDGLEAEEVNAEGAAWKARVHLQECGATSEEIEFLVPESNGGSRWIGQRVELNAMTSEQFITWLDKKLVQFEVKKVVPDEKILEDTYRRAVMGHKVEKFISKETEVKSEYEIPESLRDKVRKLIEDNPVLSWDLAVWMMADEKVEKQGDDI